jgi:membrane-associated phospholipid phosphatase
MSVFFPLVSTLSLRAAGLISSIRLEDKKDRIGPLISTIIFYVWLFLNYRQFGIGPEVFNSTILGAAIAISLSFLINNFSKISLHCIGMGGFVGAIGLYRLTIPEMSYKLELGNNMLELSPNLLLGFIIILAGLVGSARLYLKAHRSQDVFGGYLVGFLSQIVAFRILDSF